MKSQEVGWTTNRRYFVAQRNPTETLPTQHPHTDARHRPHPGSDLIRAPDVVLKKSMLRNVMLRIQALHREPMEAPCPFPNEQSCSATWHSEWPGPMYVCQWKGELILRHGKCTQVRYTPCANVKAYVHQSNQGRSTGVELNQNTSDATQELT